MISRNYLPIYLVQFLKKGLLARALTRRYVFGQVYAICFEFTTRCNLQCKMCSHTYDKHLQMADLDFTLFKKIIEDVKKLDNKNISFVATGLGEPLLYKNIIEAINYVKNEISYAYFNVITNGLLLDRNLAQSIIGVKTDELTISLNAPNKNIYKQMMGIDRYDQVVGNIIKFLELRKKLGSQKPKIAIQIMETDETQSEINSFYHFWKRYLSHYDKVFTANITSMAGAVNIDDCLNVSGKNPSRYPCCQCWTCIAIRLTGEVYPCCIGFNLTGGKNDILLGNINHDSLEDIYFYTIFSIKLKTTLK